MAYCRLIASMKLLSPAAPVVSGGVTPRSLTPFQPLITDGVARLGAPLALPFAVPAVRYRNVDGCGGRYPRVAIILPAAVRAKCLPVTWDAGMACTRVTLMVPAECRVADAGAARAARPIATRPKTNGRTNLRFMQLSPPWAQRTDVAGEPIPRDRSVARDSRTFRAQPTVSRDTTRT